MKRLILSVVLALSLAVSAKAQLGVVAGLTSSSTDLKTAVADVRNVNQYHIGLSYRFNIGGVFAVQPALVYNVKGANVGSIIGGQGSEGGIQFKTGFLELPVQFQAGIPLFGVARVYALGEPFIGYAITNSFSSSFSEAKSNGWEYVKNRVEYGLGLGGGVELFGTLQLSVKYFWNFGDLYGASNKNLSDALDKAMATVEGGKCNGIAVTLGLFF